MCRGERPQLSRQPLPLTSGKRGSYAAERPCRKPPNPELGSVTESRAPRRRDSGERWGEAIRWGPFGPILDCQLSCCLHVLALSLASPCVVPGRRRKAQNPPGACLAVWLPQGCDSGDNSSADVLRRAGGGSATPYSR